MKWNRTLKRIAAVGAATALAGVGTIAAASQAMAATACPDNHVCFYKSYADNNGSLDYAGVISDQSKALIDNPQKVAANWKGIGTIGVDGKIMDFHSSHYVDRSLLNDSVSAINNRSNHCLYLFGNSDFAWDNEYLSDHRKEGIVLGPHTGVVLVNRLGDDNDKFSSAYTIAPGNPDCVQGTNSWQFLDPDLN